MPDDAPIRQTLARLLAIIMDNNRAQALGGPGALQELVVRHLLLEGSRQHAAHRLGTWPSRVP